MSGPLLDRLGSSQKDRHNNEGLSLRVGMTKTSSTCYKKNCSVKQLSLGI